MSDITALAGKIAYIAVIGLFLVLLVLITITSIGLYYLVRVKEKGSRKDAMNRIKAIWVAFLPYSMLTFLVYWLGQ